MSTDMSEINFYEENKLLGKQNNTGSTDQLKQQRRHCDIHQYSGITQIRTYNQAMT